MTNDSCLSFSIEGIPNCPSNFDFMSVGCVLNVIHTAEVLVFDAPGECNKFNSLLYSANSHEELRTFQKELLEHEYCNVFFYRNIF